MSGKRRKKTQESKRFRTTHYSPVWCAGLAGRTMRQYTTDAPEHVRERVGRMTEAGLHLRSICYPGKDHVLILSASARQADLLAWMNDRGR
jgi:hypothetical protein